jgi:hypothetical protein
MILRSRSDPNRRLVFFIFTTVEGAEALRLKTLLFLSFHSSHITKLCGNAISNYIFHFLLINFELAVTKG